MSDFDQDGDGDDSEDFGGGDCNDLDPTISSLATEDITDGIDNNCNDQVDERFSVESLVSSVNTTGPQPLSISHDSADNAYIVFEDNGGLSLLEMGSLGWSNRSLLGINGTNTGHINGAIDGQDRWQIVYTSQSGGTDLVFRYRDTNGTWSSEMDLASVSNSGVDAELRIGFDIDSNDNPSALFYEHQEQAPVLVDVDGFTNSQISAAPRSWWILGRSVQSGINHRNLCLSGHRLRRPTPHGISQQPLHRIPRLWSQS